MPNFVTSTPDLIPAIGDPGDETARRYRYQWSYAATVCCMLLDETQKIKEVFCEHHEDILIKYTDNMFSGLQIKTKASDQEVWKTSDDGVRSSCARFVKLEAQFPGQFHRFLFLTNHPLYAAKNGKNLCYVLQSIKTANSIDDLSNPVKGFLTQTARDAHCSVDIAFRALSKTDASDDLPKLSDVEARLVGSLTEVWNRARECTLTSVMRAARQLVSECARASSLAHEDILPSYLPAMVNPEEVELLARINGKRMNRVRILEILNNGVDETAPLEGNPEMFAEPGGGTTALLKMKLEAGGFSAVSQNSALDLRDKADYLGIVWIKKHGREQGLQRYGHIRSLVLSDAARSFETTEKVDKKFGLDMLTELRARFNQRRRDGSQLYECCDEHLEGFAYSLTSQCFIQWSIDRPWETK